MSNGKDDFWDIDKLVPKKRTVAVPFVTADRTEEYTVPSNEKEEVRNRSEERKLSFDKLKGDDNVKKETFYYPEDSFIKKVTVKRTEGGYDFYGEFRKAAVAYFYRKGELCDFVHYYSYLPQYTQLNSAQMAYYLYWRTKFREGVYIKTDFSYVLLHFFEMINLPDLIAPEQGVREICRMWRAYRKAFPQTDQYFSKRLVDYCLAYNVDCPLEEISEFVFDVLNFSDFREFYLKDIRSTLNGGTEVLLAYLSDYDWHKGRYAGGENGALYREYMLEAMRRVFEKLTESRSLFSEARLAVKSMSAFLGTVCTQSAKCSLEVEYLPIEDNPALKREITSAVRYTENKLRALFGIKSRIAVKDLDGILKSIIDAYFSVIIKKREDSRRVVPEYERLYDAPRERLDIADADLIENLSWDTTARLVAAEGEDGSDEAARALLNDEGDGENELTVGRVDSEQDVDCRLSAEDIELLASLFRGDEAEVDGGAVERINTAFQEGELGDSVLEPFGDSFRLIEDYYEEIGEWLRNTVK